MSSTTNPPPPPSPPPPRAPGQPWEPGYLRRLPWLPFSAGLGVLLSAGACAAVLATSDGAPVSTWPTPAHPVQVAVLLSIFASAATFLLGVALDAGWAVAWWVRALRGADVATLHRFYDHRGNIPGALLAGRGFTRVAGASLITLAVGQAVGPLLQAASAQVPRMVVSDVDVVVQVSPGMLPTGFTGFSSETTPGQASLLSPGFATVAREFSSRTPITLSSTGCAVNSTCSMTIPAAGLDVACVASTQAYNFSGLSEEDPGADAVLAMAVTVAFNFDEDGSTINVSTTYKPTAACAGELLVQQCVLHTAQVGYPVSIINQTATLPPLPPNTNETIAMQYPSFGDLFSGGTGNASTTLGGLALLAADTYNSNVTLSLANSISGDYLVTANGIFPSSYITSPLASYSNCSIAFADPTPDILANIRELMFRAALAASNASTVQTLPAVATAAPVVYASHYGFFAGALAALVLGVGVLTGLFEGWGALGREVSLDPVELARAWGAPLLEGAASNAGADGILEEVGGMVVRYGELVGEGKGERGGEGAAGQEQEGIAASPAQTTVTPEKSTTPPVSTSLNGQHSVPVRSPSLGLGPPDAVTTPRKGVLY